jgi:hypothetical protein
MKFETAPILTPEFLRELRNLIIALAVFALCLGIAGRTFDFGWIRPHSSVTVHMNADRASGTLHPGTRHAPHRKHVKQ